MKQGVEPGQDPADKEDKEGVVPKDVEKATPAGRPLCGHHARRIPIRRSVAPGSAAPVSKAVLPAKLANMHSKMEDDSQQAIEPSGLRKDAFGGRGATMHSGMEDDHQNDDFAV